jgi:predicted MFS family arabinose efflux permease
MERFFTTLRDNTRHNAFWLYLDGIFFGLGYAAFFPYTILPGFVTHFSRNPLVINGVVALFALAAFNACFALSPQSFAGTFILNGMFIGFDAVAGTDLLLRLTPVEHRLRYIGLANTARGIASAFFPFLGGILMKNRGATVTFLATAILGVFASAVLYVGAPKSRTSPTSGW